MPETFPANTDFEALLTQAARDIENTRRHLSNLLAGRDAAIRQCEAQGTATRYRISLWAKVSLARVGMICDLSKEGKS